MYSSDNSNLHTEKVRPNSNGCYGKTLTIYKTSVAIQFQDVVARDSDKSKTLNVTMTQKSRDGWFCDQHKLTIQLSVSELTQLAYLLLGWEGYESFSAGNHGANNDKVLYANVNKNGKQVTGIHFRLQQKDVKKYDIVVENKRHVELYQCVLKRLSDAGGGMSVTDTLNILSLANKFHR